MTITAASNIFSLRAQRQVQINSDALAKSYERLSSGLRINSAADDPAGLAMAASLGNTARVATAAIRNANDGISITSIADSALNEVSSILSRMAELATQSSNGAYVNTQRSALSSEFVALGSEIERIARTTTFNGLTLLSNSQSYGIQVGFTSGSDSVITIQQVSGTLSTLGLAASGSSALLFSINASSTGEAQSASQNALNAVNNAIVSLTSVRGLIGAAESRLSTAVSYLTNTRENLLAAEGRIRDADIAQETAEMTRLQVLQQAGTAVLAQANQEPARVLDLLQ